MAFFVARTFPEVTRQISRTYTSATVSIILNIDTVVGIVQFAYMLHGYQIYLQNSNDSLANLA